MIPALEILPAQRFRWSDKPSFLSRFANLGEHVQPAYFEPNSIRLPGRIALFEDSSLNEKLYLWLLLMLTHYQDSGDWFIDNLATTKILLREFPGIKASYQQLAQAHLKYRQTKCKVPPSLASQEALIQRGLWQVVDLHSNIDRPSIPSIQQPLQLPAVALWLYPMLGSQHKSSNRKSASAALNPESNQPKKLAEKHRRKGQVIDDPDGRSGLLAFRLESYFSWSEFINLDRTEDDEEEDSAAQTANDLDVISLSDSDTNTSSRLRFDLDLPASDYDDTLLKDGILLPEWDYKKNCLLDNHCRLKVMLPKASQGIALPQHLRKKAKQLKAQFEQFKNQRYWQKNQLDGSELDLDQVIHYQTQRALGQSGKVTGLFKSLDRVSKDLSCLLLADLSLSTDAWVNNEARVIDIIRDSLFLFSEALEASGDHYSLAGFSSVKASHIRYYQIKTFKQKLTDEIRGHIAAMQPGYYTRMGAAIRYSTQQILKQASSQKLLLLLTDGKPNDIDQYEGRYGIEDTRMAIIEAKQQGVETFCITIDEDANQYLPYLFGQQNFILVKRAVDLPNKLLKLYAQLRG
ncbi:MAG: VWA domain-containing protein [Enterobacterales bacterium]|nr:VWA domain-containing protein [Enterobacterales bacterium]